MKVIQVKCPNCHASLEVNKELESAFCNYCGTQVLLEDDSKTTVERIAEVVGKEIDKVREYKSSDEYKKRLKIERYHNMMSMLFGLIFLIFGIGIMFMIPLLVK